MAKIPNQATTRDSINRYSPCLWRTNPHQAVYSPHFYVLSLGTESGGNAGDIDGVSVIVGVRQRFRSHVIVAVGTRIVLLHDVRLNNPGTLNWLGKDDAYKNQGINYHRYTIRNN